MKTAAIVLFLFTGISALCQTSDTSFSAYNQNIPGYTIQFKMVPIKGGNFTMGSPATEKGRDADEGPQQKFSISPFWMGAYEVTYDEYKLFLTDESFTQNNNSDAI